MAIDRTADGYAQERQRSVENARKTSAAGREIGPLPPVGNPKRRQKCWGSLRHFLDTYFAPTFYLKWSDDHLRFIRELETCIVDGGQIGTAMPRGSGKTAVLLRAVLWAAITGRHPFSVLIGATEADAEESLAVLRAELEDNDLLAEDWREVCHPIRCLEGIHQRRLLLNGCPLTIDMKADQIILPDVAGSLACGALIKVTGLTGRIRGLKHKAPSGKTLRPSLVLLDDPQTDESANSPSQCDKRERIVNGAVLGMAGPGRTISAAMGCTVIADGDLADRVLDRKRNPQWHGQRSQFLAAEAATASDAHKLWLEYCDIRKRCQREDRSTEEVTKFYRKNRRAMDAGYVASWRWRFNVDEISAIQHAWNVICDRGDAAFRAEYQNTPVKAAGPTEIKLNADAIAQRLSNVPRGIAPVATSRLTAFIDVQGKLLWWLVAAWSDNFTGSIIDYGSFPDQGLSYYTLSQAKRTIQQLYPNQGPEAQLYAALGACTEQLLRREWSGESGATMRIEKLLIDSGDFTDTVKLFCRQSRDSAAILPSKGRYVGCSAPAINERGARDGDRLGLNWRIAAADRTSPVRFVLFDTNYWKSFIAARLRSGMGAFGALTVFGDSPDIHRMLGDHLTAEYATWVASRGREMDEWREIPGRDNHWFDCLVGSAVAASICGCNLLDTATPARPASSGPKTRVNMPTAAGSRPFFIGAR